MSVHNPDARTSDRELLRRLLQHTRSSWKGLIGLFLLNLLSTPLGLLAPVPLKIAVDNAIGGQPVPSWMEGLLPGFARTSPAGLIGVAALFVVVIALMNQLQNLATTVVSTTTAQHLILRFRTELFRHTQRLSLNFHDTKGSTYSTHRIAYDAPAIQYVAIDGVIPLITSAVSLLSIVYVTMRLDWQLALVALAISPVLFVLSRNSRRTMRSKYHHAKDLESDALAVVQEVLGALRVVKAFGQENREERRFADQAEEGARALNEVSLTEGTFALLLGMTTALGTGATLLLGAAHVVAGTLTLGGLLLIMTYLTQLYGPLTTISRKVASMQSHLASLDRVFALLDEAPDVPERPAAKRLVRARGSVAFQQVCFQYASDRPILQDVSFELRPGTRLGITGTTGAGKSTLVNLLSRFADPTAGRILLDGVDLREYRLADLRAQFAIVLQEPILFSTSLRENIAYGKPDATDVEIVAAATAANVHQFISRLPKGYDTLVGERGMQLSGGERQRVSLARAFLKDAPILILDEPTSSVDVATEAGIMEAIERLMHGRTTLIIAHRLSTLDSCDVRLSIERGRVATISHDRRSDEVAATASAGSGSNVV